MPGSNRKTKENEMVSYGPPGDVVNPTQHLQPCITFCQVLSRFIMFCLFYLILPRGIAPVKPGEKNWIPLCTVQRRATILKRLVLASDSRPWLSPGSYCTGEQPASKNDQAAACNVKYVAIG